MKLNKIANIELNFNEEAILKKLRIEEPEDIELIRDMLNKVLSVGKPRILFGEAYITDMWDDGVSIDGKRFYCNLMKNNLNEVHRVFPFAATCGREIYEWAESIDDMFIRYWADHIMEITLRNAIANLYDIVKNNYGISKIASINPGSLEGWPIEQQTDLFELMDNKHKDIGVELTESYLMVPAKSVSGILFKSRSGYSNCKLCERVGCPSRRAPFEPELREKLTEE